MTTLYENLSGVPVRTAFCPWCKETHEDAVDGRVGCGATLDMVMHPDNYFYCTCGAATFRDLPCRSCGASVEDRKRAVREWFTHIPRDVMGPIETQLRDWANR